MLTYITHGCNQNASFEYDDLHYPCVLKIQWSMLTYITHVCNLNDLFQYADLQKYVNLYHPLSFSYWNSEVCWLTLPMGAIKMLHLSMMTCIIHVCSGSNGVCWLELCRWVWDDYLDMYHMAGDNIVFWLSFSAGSSVQWGWESFTYMFVVHGRLIDVGI